MKYKVAIKYLNIINYPYMEEYLENMAKEGWLLNKIVLGNIFIFKKVQPQELEFSISPYEMETFLNRKTKVELEEFDAVCQLVGWNYCTKSYDLFIYYKDRDSQVLDIHTDEEEEFNLLEKIGEKYIKSFYFLTPLLIFYTWRNLYNIQNNVFFYTSAIAQIIAPILPIGVIVTIVEWLKIKNFLKLNRKNVKMGNGIEYKDSKFQLLNLAYTIVFISLFLITIYILYVSIFLKDKIAILPILPVFIGTLVGLLFRFFIKPTKYSAQTKILTFIALLVLGIGLVNIVSVKNIDKLETHMDNPDRDKYKILLSSDFTEHNLEEEGIIEQDISLLVPTSYDYISRNLGNEEVENIKTIYAKALNENIAHKLFNAHIYEYKKFLKKLRHMGFDHSIESVVTNANHLWNVDEAYYLREDKTRVVLRKGKEVFVLSGEQFDNEEIIKISKEKLGLE